MANKTVTVSVSLPHALKQKLCNHFHTDNVSEAICKGLTGFLSNSAYGAQMDDFALHQLLTIEERRIVVNHSVRMTDALNQIISGYASTNMLYSTITIMLANYLYFSGAVSALKDSAELNLLLLPNKKSVDESMLLLRLLGNKWSKVMQNAINYICQSANRNWLTSIEPFAGALGIFANFRFAFHEIINDIDLRKANLYRVIKNSEDLMLLGMLAKPVNKQEFAKNKTELEYESRLSNSKVNVKAAISFLFSNLLSKRNTGYTFTKISPRKYHERMDAIYPLHERLKDTEICGLNALDVIRKHMKDENSVFIIDPPYLDTNVYEDNIVIDGKYSDEKRKFGYTEHVQLAKLLRETHQKYGNDFIFFCRITITRKKNQQTKAIMNIAELDTGDRHMRGRIDDLYWGYGYYFIDVPYDNFGTIERIITSFPFEGATAYGREVR